MPQRNLETGIKHTILGRSGGGVEDCAIIAENIHHLAPGCLPVPLIILVTNQQHVGSGQILETAGQLLMQQVFFRATALPQHEGDDGLLALGGFNFSGGQ